MFLSLTLVKAQFYLHFLFKKLSAKKAATELHTSVFVENLK